MILLLYHYYLAAIKKEVKKTESQLTGKAKEIETLESKLKDTEDAYKQQLSELSIQLQQELYIANVLQDSDRNKSRKNKYSGRKLP